MKGLFQRAVGRIKQSGANFKQSLQNRIRGIDKDKLARETKEKTKEGLNELKNLSQKALDKSAKGLKQLGTASSKVVKNAVETGKEKLLKLNILKDEKIAEEKQKLALNPNQKLTKESTAADPTSKPAPAPFTNTDLKSQPTPTQETSKTPAAQTEQPKKAWWKPNMYPYWASVKSRLPSFKLSNPLPTMESIKSRLPSIPKIPRPKLPSLPSIKMPSLTTGFTSKIKGFFAWLGKWILWGLFLFGMGYALGTSLPRQLRKYFEYRADLKAQQQLHLHHQNSTHEHLLHPQQDSNSRFN